MENRAARLALLLGAVLHLLFLVSLPTGLLNPLFVETSEGLRQASDFFGIYQAGANLVGGCSIYDSADYRNEAPPAVPFSYFYRYLPPTAYLFGLVTIVLPPWPAYWVWILVCEMILLGLVLSTLRQRQWPVSRRLFAAALWLGSFPFYLEQVMGQFSIVMAAFLWMLWRYDAGRWDSIAARGVMGSHSTPATCGRFTAGTEILRRWRGYLWSEDRVGGGGLVFGWIGGLTLKTFAVLLVLPYLRDRRLKLTLTGIGATIALSGPYFLARPGDLREFIRLNLTPFTPGLHKGSFGLHNLLREVLSRIDISVLHELHAVGPLQLNALGVLLLVAFAAIGLLALRGTLRLLDHPNRSALDLTLWTCAFFLVFKSVWEYHYVMLLAPATALYLTTGSRFVLAVGILLQLPTLYGLVPVLGGISKTAPIETWPGWLSALHLSVKSLPTLALFGWCLREAGRGRTAASATAPQVGRS